MKNFKKYLLYIFLICINKTVFANNFSDEKYFRLKINKYRTMLFSNLANKKLKIESRHYAMLRPLSNPNIKITHGDNLFISAIRDKNIDYLNDTISYNNTEIFLFNNEHINFSKKNIIIEASTLNIGKNAFITCKNFLFLGNNIILNKDAKIYITENFTSFGTVEFKFNSYISRIDENVNFYEDSEGISKFILFGDNSALYFGKKNNFEYKEYKTEFKKYIMPSEKKKKFLIE